jgi:hypothetical protein
MERRSEGTAGVPATISTQRLANGFNVGAKLKRDRTSNGGVAGGTKNIDLASANRVPDRAGWNVSLDGSHGTTSALLFFRRALAIVSAVIAHLLIIGGDGLAGVVRRRRHLDPRPLSEDGEEAGHVFAYLPGVLISEVAPDAGLPDLARPVDQVVIRWD